MTIYIEVSGGMVQGVYATNADNPVDVEVFDFDLSDYLPEDEAAEHDKREQEFSRIISGPYCQRIW